MRAVSPATFISAFIALFLLQPSLACGEPGSIGRDSRGKPYRIDASGYRISDRLAELEVTVDDLNRQVRALEDEVQEKDQTIERLRSGIAKPEFVEGDLLAQSEAAPSQDDTFALGTQDACESYTLPLKAKISKLENQVRQPAEITAEQCVPFVEQVELELARLKTSTTRELDQIRNQTEKSQSLSRREQETALAGLRQELEKQKKELRGKVEELEKLKAKNEQLEIALKQQAASKPTQLAQANTASVTFRPRGKLENVDSAGSTLPPSGLKALQKTVKERIRRVQKLIVARKNLHDKHRKLKKGIVVKLQRLATPAGTSFDNLRALSQRLASETDAERAMVGLEQIEALLNDDIEVLKRLLKRA